MGERDQSIYKNGTEPVETHLDGMIRDRGSQQDLKVKIEKAEVRVKEIDKLLSAPGLNKEQRDTLQSERAETYRGASEAERDMARINKEAGEKMTIRFSEDEIREIRDYIHFQGFREKELEKLHKIADQLVEYFFDEYGNEDLIKRIQDEAAKVRHGLLGGPIQIKTKMLLQSKERQWVSELIDENGENLGGAGWNYFVDRFAERLEEEVKKKNMGFNNERKFRALLPSVRVEAGTKTGGYSYVFANGEGQKVGIAPSVPSSPALEEAIAKKLLLSEKGAIEDAIARGESDVDVKRLLKLPYDKELNAAMVTHAKDTEQDMTDTRKKEGLEAVSKEISEITQALDDMKGKVSYAESIKMVFESEAEFNARKGEVEALQEQLDEQEGILGELGKSKTFKSRTAGFFGKQADRMDPGIYTSPAAAKAIEKIKTLQADLRTAKQAKDSALAQCRKIGEEELGLREGKAPSGTLPEAKGAYEELVKEEKLLQTRLDEAKQLKSEYQKGRSLFGKKSAGGE